MTLREQMPGRFSIVIGLGAFVVYLSSATFTTSQSADPLSASLAAWKLTQFGTLQLPEYLGVAWVEPTTAGALSDRLPGVIGWGVPFYALFGNETFTVFPGAVAGAAATALAVALSYLVALRVQSSPRVALIAAALFGFGTGAWTVSADGLWPHGPDQAAILGSMLAVATQHFLVAGLVMALAVMTRPHTAIIAAALGLQAGWERRSLRPVIAIGLTSSLGVLALVLYGRFIYGRSTVLNTYNDRVVGAQGSQAWLSYPLDVVGTLVSPLRGMLVYSPFLVVLALGVPAAWRVAPGWVRAAALGGVGYLAVQVLGNVFSGGAYFTSYRLPLEPLTAAFPLLVLAWVHGVRDQRRRAWVFAIACAWAVGIHAALAWGQSIPPYDDPWRDFPPWQLVVDGAWWRVALGAVVAAATVHLLRPAAMRPTPIHAEV